MMSSSIACCSAWCCSTRCLSCRISLSPFPTLRHHSGTISGPSITFQTFPSHSITLLPFQPTPFLTPSTPSTFPSSPLHSLLRPLHQHSCPSLLFPASLFLFTILRFSLHPASVPSSPFLSVPSFCPPFPISAHHSLFLSVPCFYPFILRFCLAVSWTKLLSNITINRHVVLSHFTVHLHFLSIYKPVYVVELQFVID